MNTADIRRIASAVARPSCSTDTAKAAKTLLLLLADMLEAKCQDDHPETPGRAQTAG